MSSQGTGGRIITFYSYKGGTGRSMALANIAWILAAAGRRVLTVDWDLEAPGLHRYLHPFLLDPESTATEGVVDFVTEYVRAAISPGRGTEPRVVSAARGPRILRCVSGHWRAIPDRGHARFRRRRQAGPGLRLSGQLVRLARLLPPTRRRALPAGGRPALAH